LRVNEIVRLNYNFPDPPNTSYLIESHPVSSVQIDLNRSREAIFDAINSTGRNEIRAIEKLGNRVAIAANNEGVITDYLDVYNSFARAKGDVPPVTPSVVETYSRASDIFVLYLDGRPMCGHLTVRDDDAKRAYSLFCGNRRLESKADAAICGKLARYLFWHEICLYRARGMEIYELGGIAHNDLAARFNTLKLSLGGQIVTEYCHTFSGSSSIARLVLLIYNRLRRSRASALLHRV